MGLFTQKEIIIMISVIGSLLFIVLILSISEFIQKRKDKKNIPEIIEEKHDELLIEDKKDDVSNSIIEVKEEIKPQESHEVEYVAIDNHEEMVPLIMEIEPEVEVVKLEKEEFKELPPKDKAQIELLKVEEELLYTPSLEDTITNLETIEEENAIISYQELINNTKELDIVTCDDGDEPITLTEVFKMFNDQTDEGMKITDSLSSVPLTEAYQGEFLSTSYVSPINGIETESLTEIQLENTANLEKLEKEIRKTNEFLNILNELKKNLD